MRIDRDWALMSTAGIWARRSTCLRRKVGAVIAQENRIISQGYNGAPSGKPHCTPETCNDDNPCTNTVHAEINAIAFAARYGISVEGATLYTTLAPCLNCSKAMINSGIKKVVYLDTYRDLSGIELLRDSGVSILKLHP